MYKNIFCGTVALVAVLLLVCGDKDSGTGPALSSEKDIASFYFQAAKNSALTVDVVAEIFDTTILAIVPAGTDISALVATFFTTGETVTISGVAQQSGVTANNFTNPVMYVVTAEDATTKNYLVTVRPAQSNEKAITAYSFQASDNAALSVDVTGVISDTSISVTVPTGTDVTALITTYTITGQSATVAGVSQQSGVTANDFTSPVTYTVTAEDGSTRDYTVTVTVASDTSDTAKAITAFSFTAAANAALSADVAGTITDTNIAATVPFNTDVTALIATFTATGDTVRVGTTVQQSGTTANNFTNNVVYTVIAGDGTSRNYTAHVTIAPDTSTSDTSKALLTFSFKAAVNAALSVDVAGTITDTNVAATVPFSTDVTALIATFTSTGDTIRVGTTVQKSDTTANDFTSNVVYTVVARDGTTRNYTASVTIAPDTTTSDTSKALLGFAFEAAANTALSADVAGTITDTSVAATVPFSTDVTALIATFTTTGDTVRVGANVQQSGTTANDFTSNVLYTVFARDGTSRNYLVTVTIAPDTTTPDTAKAMTAFAFEAATNAGLSADVTASITGTAVAATVPFGTDVTALVATFTITGDSAVIGNATQQSGTTANDFTSEVVYKVIAGDQTNRNYAVTVTIAPDTTTSDTSKSLLTYVFAAANNGQLQADAAGVITGTAIAVEVPAGTDVTALIASFTTNGDTVRVGTTIQQSGTTPNDFSADVVYTVVARDTSTRDYTVTVTFAGLNTITAFSFPANRNAVLDANVTATIVDSTITALVPAGIDVTALVAVFETQADSVLVGSTVQVSGATANDFTSPVTYTAYASGAAKNYVATVVFDTIQIFGTWATAATDTFTMIVDVDSLEVQRAADTTYAALDYVQNSDSLCILNWTDNPQATRPFQKLDWEFISADVISVQWYNYSNNRNAAIGDTQTTAVDTLTRQR